MPPRMRSNDLSCAIRGIKTSHSSAFCQVHQKEMVVNGNYKLIWDKEANTMQLFNLKTDPGEIRSVIDLKPDIAARLKSLISDFDKSHAQKELRPIVTKQGQMSWPVAIQRALGEDMKSIPGLIELIKNSPQTTVKQKAAALLFKLWNPQNSFNAININKENDSETAVWLLLTALKSSTDKKNLSEKLEKKIMLLKKFTPAWNEGIIVMLDNYPKKYADLAIDLVENPDISVDLKNRAISLFGKHNIKQSFKTLLTTLNNYQLTLATADAMGKIKNRKFIKPLIKRLKRERFSTRKAKIAEALGQMKAKEASKAIALELLNERPPENVLEILSKLGAAKQVPQKYIEEKKSKNAVIITGKLNKFYIRAKRATKLFIFFKSNNAPQSVTILCNQNRAKTIYTHSGKPIYSTLLKNCISEKNNKIEIKIESNEKPEATGIITTVY
jgi:HEAT repeat protein